MAPLIARIRGGLANRPRVRLNSNSSNNNNISHIPPHEEAISATSSSDAHLSDDDSTYTPTLQQHPDDSNDPYSDVRVRLDELSSLDRARYALHTLDDDDDEEDSKEEEEEEQISWWNAYSCYLCYAVVILVGHVHAVCDLVVFAGELVFGKRKPKQGIYPSENREQYASLLKRWEQFYMRAFYTRAQDCCNRPLASNPGATIQVLERISNDGLQTMEIYGSVDQQGIEDFAAGKYFVTTYDGRVARECLNLGSYNYLGFADDWHKTCAKEVKAALAAYPVSTGSSLMDYGRTELHRKMEEQVAKFVGKEDAICLNMGFNTNATTIPSLVGPGDLIISDRLNHTSIVNGARASGAAIRIFRHKDTKHLEEIVREAILMGKPRTRRPWRSILVVVEGIYSMEGSYCDLKNVVRICKKYGAYVYLDEAHSIGALGFTGRGCSEYAGVDPADIDIMMGTFSKSFGAMGGYIAASKETITFLRKQCAGSVHHNSLSPAVCQQVLSALKIITGEDGTNRGARKLQSLRDNANYFRMRLQDMGLRVLGHYDSPVVPVLAHSCKGAAFSRECFKRGLAVVVVGSPAVPVTMERARFCISSSHTRADLDRALREIDEIADVVNIRYGKRRSTIISS